MAVTAGGTPYVESTDLVANYPAASLTLANKVDTKVDYALPVNAQTGTTYTFVLADGLRLTTASNGSASTYTVPPQSSVVWLANSVIRLVNYGAGVVTVAGGSGVTVTNAAKTLAQFESVALIRTGSDAWTLVPFSGGVSSADFSNAATGTYTGFKYLTFSASGTITITKAGLADIVIAGSGGGGSNANGGAGGAGGIVQFTDAFLPVGTLTVTIGAGGAALATSGANGNTTLIGDYFAPGGGGGAASLLAGSNGASGGGGKNAGVGGLGISPVGNDGGGSVQPGVAGAGGGGGAGAVGLAGTSTVGGNGGAGVNVTLAGTTPTGAYVAGNYGLGGGGGGGSVGGTAGTATDGGGAGSASTTGTAGTANTGGGGGGGGGGSAGTLGGNGGSGIVIVRVAA